MGERPFPSPPGERLLVEPLPRDWAEPPAFLLLYPNAAGVGMSNLGFQFLLARLLLGRGETFDRAFPLADRRSPLLPPAPAAVATTSLGGRPAAAFPVHLVSLSFETDQLHLLRLLRDAGLPLRPRDRRQGQPIVVAGGAAVAGNPAPVLAWADAVVVGDGEPVLDELVGRLATYARGACGREEAVASLRGLPGVLTAAGGVPAGWRRALLRSLDEAPARTVLCGEDDVFRAAVLVELTRGCARGCRFCLTGWQCRPLRRLGRDAFLEVIDGVADWRGLSVGLVGASLADHPDLLRICRDLRRRRLRFSTSSLRLEALDPEVLDAVAAGGSRTLTFAPEAGTERLRRAIGKPLRDGPLREALARLAARPDGQVKLYFMVGLPTETDADVAAIEALLEEAQGLFRAAGRAGALKVGLSAFVPKPQTPFQWAPLAPPAVLERRLGRLLRTGGRLGLRVSAESPRTAQVEALLARADAAVMERVLAFVEREPGRAGASAFRAALGGRAGPLSDLEREIPAGRELPWDALDPLVDRAVLRRGYEAALAAAGAAGGGGS